MSKRTLPDFARDARRFGLGAAVKDRLAWRGMNMDPTDIADTGNYTFLVNGKGPAAGETFLFRPGERVKLRLVNGSAMTFFDVRIPGLKMTVVASDGRPVEPVTVDELRIAVAEAYDVIVEPTADAAYAVFAESVDRSGHALATLAPREGMRATPPARRPRALLTLAEMGHGAGSAHGHAGHHASAMDHAAMGHGLGGETGARTAFPKVDHGMGRPAAHPGAHGRSDQGAGLGAEGEVDGSGRVLGWSSGAPWGARVLSYADLRALEPHGDARPPTRDVVVRLTGNMERYVWTLDGKVFGKAEPIRMRFGERVRVTFVNETMMAHPMHLHGMFMQAETGAPLDRLPEKTVVAVAPGRTASVIITADQAGEWAFHCHLLYHMESGMMQKLVVARTDGPVAAASAPVGDPYAGHAGHAH